MSANTDDSFPFKSCSVKVPSSPAETTLQSSNGQNFRACVFPPAPFLNGKKNTLMWKVKKDCKCKVLCQIHDHENTQI